MTLAAERFDLVVIGSGPAGEKGAAQAAYFGKKVAIVERMLEPGGVSVHTGTLPSKTLREAALYLTGFQRRELYGMTLRLDRKKNLRQLVGRLRDVTERQTRQIRRNLERHRIELVAGSATLLPPDPSLPPPADPAHGSAKLVSVTNLEGQETRRLVADVVLVATGSSPLPPRGITYADPDVEDSDQVLDLDRIPERLVVVGGGVIGCEYACVFAALGTRVTLIEGRDRLLGFLDSELSAAIKTALERMSSEVLLGDAVETTSRVEGLTKNALRIQLKSGRVLKADKVLYSAGRKGNTQGLGLESLGVVFDERGRISVDENFRTNVPGVYAAGDVIGFPALAATSMDQGRAAMRRAFGVGFAWAVSPIFPYGIYTIPEISMLGATEEELKARGTRYEAGRSRYENNARGQITGDPDGFVKLLFDPDTKQLLGVHIIGGGATELIHIPQMVMMRGGGLDDFLNAVFNFPTLSECFKYAAYDGLQRLTHRAGGAPIEIGAAQASKLARERLSPGARAWFLGADLTDPFSREPRPVTLAAMDRWRRIRYRTWTFNAEGTGLIAPDIAADGFVLAIDGPQGLAAHGHHVRQSETALHTAGRSPSRLPKPGEKPYAGFIAGSVALWSSLREAGFGVLGEVQQEETVLIEVYPGDLWTKWAGRRLQNKTTHAGRRARYDLLRGLGLELPVGPEAVTHDQLDAAAAAFCAYLWATSKAQRYGTAPVYDAEARVLREGFIVSA